MYIAFSQQSHYTEGIYLYAIKTIG